MLVQRYYSSRTTVALDPDARQHQSDDVTIDRTLQLRREAITSVEMLPIALVPAPL
jgi:hypothetical protein